MDLVALGVVLVLVGMAIVVVEAHASTGGILGLLGTLAAVTGIGLTMAGAGVPLVVAVPVSVVLALLGIAATLVMVRQVVLARRQEVCTGADTLVGRPATVRTWSFAEGQVAVDGALWRARLAYGWQEPRPVPGQTVIVAELDGLTVSVRRPHVGEEAPPWAPSSLSL